MNTPRGGHPGETHRSVDVVHHPSSVNSPFGCGDSGLPGCRDGLGLPFGKDIGCPVPAGEQGLDAGDTYQRYKCGTLHPHGQESAEQGRRVKKHLFCVTSEAEHDTRRERMHVGKRALLLAHAPAPHGHAPSGVDPDCILTVAMHQRSPGTLSPRKMSSSPSMP